MTARTEESLPVLTTTCADVVVLGATGDLAHRKLLPALAAAEARGALDPSTRVVGVARGDLDDDAFRASARTALDEHAATVDVASREALLRRIRYARVDLGDPDDWEQLVAVLPPGTGRARVFYLACAPDLFGQVCAALGSAGLADHRSRVVLEKPLGTDLDSSRRVSDAVAEVFEERQVFRIDHYLGKETVQNLLVLRFGNALFGPLWDARSIDSVEITVSETLGVGGRGGYYDGSGALRDMVQNHLLQLLCLVAMEPPDRLAADAVRDAKVAVLRALRPWTPERAASFSVRGQYAGYQEECGVLGSSTETYVALRAEVDNWRWAGVPFYLRTGKRLARQASEIVVNFRDVPHWVFPGAPPGPNRLVLGLQPHETVHLELRAKVPGPGPVRLASRPLRLDLSSAFSVPSAAAYERLLLDVLQDDPVLFMRRDEVEAAWAWIDPLREAWDSGAAPLVQHLPGSPGPQDAVELLTRDGRRWHGDDTEQELSWQN